MMQTEKTLLVFDPDQIKRSFQSLENKLDQILSERSGIKQEDPVEWITAKKFMEMVSIKAYNTFYKFMDKMPDELTRKINGKIYVHRDTIRKYFEGAYNE